MYTKNGKPLQVYDDIVYSKSGKFIGRIDYDKVFGSDGKYVGSIDGDRLVYRSTDSACISSSCLYENVCGIAMANACCSAIGGDEPDTPD